MLAKLIVEILTIFLYCQKNLALVSSSVEMIGSQRLKIRSSSAKGTVLVNLDYNGTKDFFFLPNYNSMQANNKFSENLKYYQMELVIILK